ncbi:MAG TPA: NUDIX hydrolase [Caldilineaceae bacterium]|nr:NUDIX hydrolase [Caldilineaceae bacterium]
MDGTIRLRACLAVVKQNKILLVAHYNTDSGPIQWLIPGGRVEYGEGLREAAMREFHEETGLEAIASRLLEVSEVLRVEPPWHSVTITFLGNIVGGHEIAEQHPTFGQRALKWFSVQDALQANCHPRTVVEKALGSDSEYENRLLA